MIVPIVLVAASLLALLLYGYVVAMIMAVVSFWSLSSLQPRKRFRAILTAAEDRDVEALRHKRPEEAGALAESAFGSVDFNGRALARAAVLRGYDEEKAQLLRVLATYAHKTRSVDKVRRIIERAEEGYRLWLAKEKTDTNQITREDLRLLESIAKSGDIVALLEGVPGEKAETFRTLVQRCKKWQEAVLKELVETFDPQSGDLVAFTLENDRYIIGAKRPRIVAWFYQFVLGSDATHMAILVKDAKGVVTESHMWGTPSVYNRTRLTVGSFGNRFYRANAEMFVDKK
jgi:hypothetical protein